jgi:hypothetical protein
MSLHATRGTLLLTALVAGFAAFPSTGPGAGSFYADQKEEE